MKQKLIFLEIFWVFLLCLTLNLPGLLGFLLFFLWRRMAVLNGWILFCLGNISLFGYLIFFTNEGDFFLEKVNFFIKEYRITVSHFWQIILLKKNFLEVLYIWSQRGMLFLCINSVLIAGVLAAVDQFFRSSWKVKKKSPLLSLEEQQGVLLGVSESTGKDIIIPDFVLNQGVMILGTTGGGKSITLRRFYEHAIIRREPLIIVDGKPTEATVQWIKERAEQMGCVFYGFNCADHWHYDALAEGSFTELKDKIMSLKDTWESDYYRSVAEDYLQTICAVLKFSQTPFDLETIVSLLEYSDLVLFVRQLKGETEFLKTLQGRVKRLSHYKQEDIKGLAAHLNLLVNSELGTFLKRKEQHTFSLKEVVQQRGIAYFALPSLRYPYFAKMLGKLIINDIKSTIDRKEGESRIFTIFDEFSVFAGEQVLNLITMGRAKGVHAVLGTQGISDLKKVHVTFSNQILNCVNTLICHRLNDEESAKTVSQWGGMEDVLDYTYGLNEDDKAPRTGSLRVTQKFSVNSDMIKKDLNPGEAFYFSKEKTFIVEKVRVKYT
ncbi:MAG: type IV secretion system DNA-binding domain-containing protein [Proteobacteria bacterium]|nr:type IV secretion system DNA-binding domain-containing protein [Pseudomonadota bacterium]